MSLYDSIDRVKRINYLIHSKATGTPNELAKKLNISERWVYEYIDMLKHLGAPIIYCKTTRSYIYKDEGQFLIEFRE